MPDSNFWVQVQQITGLDPLEAQKHAEFVRRAFLDDIAHIKAVKKANVEGDDVGGGRIDPTRSTINIQAGPFNQTIPLTKKGIELANGFLDLLEKQMWTELETPESENPQNEEGDLPHPYFFIFCFNSIIMHGAE